MALCLKLCFLKAVDLGMLVGLVLVDHRCPSLNLGLGQAWVLLPDVVVLVSCFFDVLLFWGFSLSSKSWGFCEFVLGSGLHYLTRIVSSLRPGLGLGVALVLVVGLPSLLERQVWAWRGILMALQELWRTVLFCLLAGKLLQSVVSKSHQ